MRGNLLGGGQLRPMPRKTPLGEQASRVAFADENKGVVRLWDGRLLFTADGGQNW
jgi:photosystem II stability/assembly factor-like uncharacterized protein